MAIDQPRRSILAASLALADVASPLGRLLAQGAPAAAGPVEQLAALERRHGGRLGVAILDAHNGRRVQHRGEQRFAMCSTFKLLAAALVLQRVDRGEESLGRRIVFTRGDVVPYSPTTEGQTGAPGMTLADLCVAAVASSDNTAANLLLASFGGPAALTAFAGSLGDGATRLDRIEPELNEARPGDPRDTTTPAGMLKGMHALLVEDTLSQASRTQLIDWMVAATTGGKRLRAGFPAGWRAGDKTGSCNANTSNDLAIAWPPGRGPVLVAAYYDATGAVAGQGDAVLVEVGRIAAGLVAGSAPAP